MYSLFFILWGSVMVLLVYWKITNYLDALARDTVIQRANLFVSVPADRLLTSLEEHYRLDTRSLNHYGLFSADGQSLSGKLGRIPEDLPIDGQVHLVPCASGAPNSKMPMTRCHALAMPIADGRTLVFIRDNRNSSLTDLGEVILDAIAWSTLPMAIPGLLGWYYLRHRPLHRIQRIDVVCRKIAAGDLAQRLPISHHRDELDIFSGIVNVMLDRIERLMVEVKGISDSIAHDLRTPLTRLRAHLYRMRQQAVNDPARVLELDQALEDTDALLVRFRALLRISELETGVRTSAFENVDAHSLLREAYDFYIPVAEEKPQHLDINTDTARAPPLYIRCDRSLMFEALTNIIDNASKFTPENGRILLRLDQFDRLVRFEIHDSGPGIPISERRVALQRFHRGSQAQQTNGHGMGLSIVVAITDLHGFMFSIDDSPFGGVLATITCPVAPTA